MSRVEVTQETTPLSDGILKTDLPLDGTLQVVKDQLNNSSTLLLATDETQVNSVLRINTDASELLDLQDTGSNNRFNINRDVQKINLDFASKPSDLTTQVGSIRTAIDGTNLSDAVKFQENGQVTFTERVKVESDSTVTTQTSSVVQASTTNASLVLAPNGTGAIIASVPDGTTTGGNARGNYALDLQRVRTAATQVPADFTLYSTILNGQNNFVNASHCSILSGNGNTVNFSAGYSTVINGLNCVANGTYSLAQGYQSVSNSYGVSLGYQNNLSGQFGFVVGRDNVVSGDYSAAFNRSNRAISSNTFAYGDSGFSYLQTQSSHGSTNLFGGTFFGNGQSSEVIATKQAALTTAATTVLSLDGTGTTNLIIPNGNNRAWNVQVNWVAVVTAITGTATGITVGDVVTSIDLLAFKRVGGISSASAHTSTATKTMVTTPAQYAACAIAYTAGASQEMALTFTGPTFVGGGSVTMRVVARIELSEVAW
jgi:hypothetical protein